jgi:hypothetical protein
MRPVLNGAHTTFVPSQMAVQAGNMKGLESQQSQTGFRSLNVTPGYLGIRA